MIMVTLKVFSDEAFDKLIRTIEDDCGTYNFQKNADQLEVKMDEDTFQLHSWIIEPMVNVSGGFIRY